MMKNNLVLLTLLFVTACSTLDKKETPAVFSVETTKIDKKPDDIRLSHKYFTISYNKKHRLANWVKYSIKKEDLNGPGIRPKKFKADPILVKMGVTPVLHDDYTNSGFARGHLAPAEDFSRSQEAIESTFIMSNVIPQKGSINSGSWAQLERQIRTWACGEESITVITGPVLTNDLSKIHTDISIPQEFFKIVIDETPPKKAIAFVYNQSKKNQSLIKNKIVLKTALTLNHIQSEVTNDSNLNDWKSCK
jgi:endonuclease G